VRSRVELFEGIRRDRRTEGLSIRQLAECHQVHRRTVRQSLGNAVPPPRKVYPRRPRPAIEQWALGDRRVATGRPARAGQTAAYRAPGLAADGAALTTVEPDPWKLRGWIHLPIDDLVIFDCLRQAWGLMCDPGRTDCGRGTARDDLGKLDAVPSSTFTAAKQVLERADLQQQFRDVLDPDLVFGRRGVR
jgi:hypothetical protein